MVEDLTRADAIRFLIKQGELPTEDKIRDLLGEKQYPSLASTATESLLSKSRAAASSERSESQSTSQKQRIAAEVELASRKVDDISPHVKIIENAKYEPKKSGVNDFVKYYRNRYTNLKNLLMARPETSDAVSINRLRFKERSKVTVVGMVSNIEQFSTGTIKLEIEDLSGAINAIISGKKDKEFLDQLDFLAVDEVIALKGTLANKTLFVDEIIWPGIPHKTKKTAEQEVYAAFSGDLHAGSNTFLPEKLNRFISWLRGEQGDARQQALAKKTKYVFLQGDVVDGIGIYQNQDKELHVTDIYQQYDYAAKFLAKIPTDKTIIVCPGNHDALRLAEPQPPLSKTLAAPFYDLPNAVCVSNPSTVNIHAINGAPGFDVLMYHGYSFDYFLEHVKGLREAGGYSAPDKLLEFLLKRRHLAPSYHATLKLPMTYDHLLIKNVPDIFTTGHLHKVALANYKGVLTIASSCWQSNTSFQDRVGLKADPAKVPLVNLKTGNARILDFN